jgi:hypothetical protein
MFKLILAAAISISTFPVHAESQAAAGCRYPWPQIKSSWSNYQDSPTEKAATALLKNLRAQEGRENPDCEAFKSFIERMDVASEKLSSLTSRKSTHAIEIAFALYKFSDGAFAETLSGVIGNSSTQDPETFLTQVSLFNPNTQTCSFITNTESGEDYTPQALKKIDEKRLKSLSSVKIPALAKMKATCIEALKTDLKKIKTL